MTDAATRVAGLSPLKILQASDVTKALNSTWNVYEFFNKLAENVDNCGKQIGQSGEHLMVVN